MSNNIGNLGAMYSTELNISDNTSVKKYYVKTLTGDSYRPVFSAFREDQNFTTEVDCVPEGAQFERFVPFLVNPYDSYDINAVVTVKNENGELEDISVNKVEGEHFVPDDNSKDRIRIYDIEAIAISELNHHMYIRHNHAYDELAIVSLRSCSTTTNDRTYYLLGKGDDDFQVGDNVRIRALHTNVSRLINDNGNFNYSGMEECASKYNHRFAVYCISNGTVTVVNEIGEYYEMPAFALFKDNFTSVGRVDDQMVMAYGSIIRYIGACGYDMNLTLGNKYVIVGMENDNYIVEPYESMVDGNPDYIAYGVPVDDSHYRFSKRYISAFMFEGIFPMRKNWTEFKPSYSCGIITSEYSKYNNGDIVTIKTRDEIVEEYGLNNDNEPNTLCKYTYAISELGGKSVAITGVYGDRYTVEGLDDVLISVDMIKGSGYAVLRDATTDNDNWITALREMMNKKLSSMIGNFAEFTISANINNLGVTTLYYRIIKAADGHHMMIPELHRMPMKMMIEHNEYITKQMMSDTVIYSDATIKDIVAKLERNCDIAVFNVYIRYNNEGDENLDLVNDKTIYEAQIGDDATQSSKTYIYGKNHN